MPWTELRKISLVVVLALAFSGAISTGSSAADDTLVRFGARVSWIAAETMVVSTEGGPAVSVDLSQVAQDEYQRLATGARVIVTGTLGRNRVLATSIESVEP
jgi:cold shock CspA family protein